MIPEFATKKKKKKRGEKRRGSEREREREVVVGAGVEEKKNKEKIGANEPGETPRDVRGGCRCFAVVGPPVKPQRWE